MSLLLTVYFNFSTVPVVESAEPEPADPPQVAAVEETPIPTITPPPPQQPAAENSKGTVNTCCTHTTVHVCELGIDLLKHTGSLIYTHCNSSEKYLNTKAQKCVWSWSC